jgi:hypothetical protein
LADGLARRTAASIDTQGLRLITEFGAKDEPGAGGVGLRGADILWQYSDADSITESVALADGADESWVAHNLNSERLALHQTTGDGTPLFELPVSAENPDRIAVASAEDVSLGVLLSQDPNGVTLRAFTSAGGNTPVWDYAFDPLYYTADYRAVDVSNDGSIVAAVASEPSAGVAWVAILDGASGATLIEGQIASTSIARIELTDDGSRAMLTLGATATILDTATLATLHSFAVSGAGGYHRISGDGKVAVAGGFNYVAWRESGGVWSQLFNRTQSNNWFGGGAAVSDDGNTMFVASYNYATGYLLLTYRVIDLVTGTQLAQTTTQGAGAFQDTVWIAHASADGTRFAVASWGTQNNAHPEVQVFDRDLNLVAGLDTPGSPFAMQFSSDGGTLLVGSKAVHANTFGRGSETYAARSAAPCPGDLDGDGAVSIADLATLLSNFGLGAGATPEQGDLDGDEDVDIKDLAAMLSVFGTIC